ncbi:MAG: hypothetical protein ACK4NC_03255 [Candidatus Gracilibacteria bacterium]
MNISLIESIRKLIDTCEFLSDTEKNNYSRLLPSLEEVQLHEMEEFLMSELHEHNLLKKRESHQQSFKMKSIRQELHSNTRSSISSISS